MFLRNILLVTTTLSLASCVTNTPSCRHSLVFRSLDGTCNNIKNPLWGAAGQTTGWTPGSRAQPVAYLADVLEVSDGESVVEQASLWSTAWLQLVASDILQVEEERREKGIVNRETPYLDLSNIYRPKKTTQDQDSSLLDKSELLSKLAWGSTEDNIGINPALFLLSTEHKRLTASLSLLNPGWDTARAEHEARKLVIAQYQHITVAEMMPVLVGLAADQLTQLEYSSSVEPRLSPVELLVGLQAGVGLTPNVDEVEVEVAEGYDDKVVMMLTSGVRRWVGGVNSNRLGRLLRLVQDGRRMSVDGWDEVRKNCGLRGCRKGEDAAVIDRLAQGYEGKVGEADAIVGGIAERPVTGGILGATLACILDQMIEKLIISDRLWYKHNLFVDKFSDDQLKTIESVTLASLICSNIDELATVQPNAMLLPDSYLNHEVACSEIKPLDLNLWDYGRQVLDKDINVDVDNIEEALLKAEEDLGKMRAAEYELWRSSGAAPTGSSAAVHASLSKPSRQAVSVANNSVLFEFLTYELLNHTKMNRQKRSADESLGILPHDMQLASKVIEHKLKDRARRALQDLECDARAQEDGPCDHTSKYRTFNGRCNNLKYPDNGAKGTEQTRLLPPEYDDYVSSPRRNGRSGKELPNVRRISQSVHKAGIAGVKHPDSKYTMSLMQWGQFVDHDLTKTPQIVGHDGSTLDCSACESRERHSACHPIAIPFSDAYFRHSGGAAQRCMAFTRSLPAQQRLGAREQVNDITSYLDSSHVYGSDACSARQLREDTGYKMKITRHPQFHGRGAKPLLPQSAGQHDCKTKDGYCYIAGDGRVNEQPGLTAIHTLLVREHNRVADRLAEINPHWDDERVFQEARKIVSAINQHITFNEFLPRILGKHFMSVFGCSLEKGGSYFKGYDTQCSAAILNEFSTAAYRFGHSLIRGIMEMGRLSTDSELETNKIRLRDHFNSPDMLRSYQFLDGLMSGQMVAPCGVRDAGMTDEVRDHLFEEKEKPFSGLDLASLNIMRGRDHGLPGYTKYRKFCKLSEIKTFQDLTIHMDQAVADKLGEVYDSVEDIDLFTGGLAERRISGALVGPTFACIIGVQFSHLRRCDRFWYESDDPTVRFTMAQLREIRSESLSGLICRNSDHPETGTAPRHGFDQPDRLTNPTVKCLDDIGHLDLRLWKEEVDSSCRVDDVTIAAGSSQRVSPCLSCVCTGDGAKCETVTVTSCVQLIRQFGVDEVEKDKNCHRQCVIRT